MVKVKVSTDILLELNFALGFREQVVIDLDIAFLLAPDYDGPIGFRLELTNKSRNHATTRRLFRTNPPPPSGHRRISASAKSWPQFTYFHCWLH